MKRWIGMLALAAAAATLSGCYYEPDYGYVRGGTYHGGAYYGRGPTTVIEDDYYTPGYYAPGWYEPGWYGSGWYGYPPGVSVGIGGVWYDGGHRQRGRDWHRDHRGGDWDDDRHGSRGGDWHGDQHGSRGGDWHQDHDRDRRDGGGRDGGRWEGGYHPPSRDPGRYSHQAAPAPRQAPPPKPSRDSRVHRQ